MSFRIAIAAPSEVCAEAAGRIAGAGGSVVDCAIAAATAAMLSEPGVVGPGAGAFVVVAEPREIPEVYDGYVSMPTRRPDGREGTVLEAQMEYGGGITTLVGPGSVAIPGAWAAFGDAHATHGNLAWADVLAPAIALARDGITLGSTSATYLAFSHLAVFGHDPASFAALHPGGAIPTAGMRVWLPGLQDSLEAISAGGADEFYRGALGRAIGDDLYARGSLVNADDMAGYRTAIRAPLEVDVGAYRVFTNPAPAVGGAALAALLSLCPHPDDTTTMIAAQRRVFEWRRSGADLSSDRNREIARLLGDLPPDAIRSPSTAHVSVVDRYGSACAITLSAGYGSGVIPTGTGLWMNNALGEVELVGDGSHLRPGDRLNSNMAPTIARGEDGTTVVIGSPGADRITTAIAQTLLRLFEDPADPEGAVAAPRLHVEVGETLQIAVEPGIDVPDSIRLPVRRFEDIHMFFGGIGMAMRTGDGRLMAVSDPRRNGVSLLVS
jgi:gamma-glutamyltranspeptidase/glutathione hydrolase